MATAPTKPQPQAQPSHGSLLDRQPPRDLAAEKAVLGSMLLAPMACDDLLTVVRADEFYDPSHAYLYATMQAIHATGKGLDTTLLLARLKADGQLDEIGGMPYLAEIVQAVPTAANAVHYATIVRDHATLRAVIDAGTEMVADAFDVSHVETSADVLARAEQRLFSILDRQRSTQDCRPLSEVISELQTELDARFAGGGDVRSIATGYRDLDARIGGLRKSELTILAARPSMGKTALALNVAEHVALTEKKPVLFVSLEMSALEVSERMLCAHARVDSFKVRAGMLTAEDHRTFAASAGALSEAPLYVDATPSQTIGMIAATARRIRRRHGLELVIVDYLQLIAPDDPKSPRQEQVATISRRLKALARELAVPVICVAQLNRQGETTKEYRPRLSHLRESGAIEQDADMVLFIHRPGYYSHEREDDGKAELIVGKNRNGPTVDVNLVWFAPFTRFDSLARQYGEEDWTPYRDEPDEREGQGGLW